MTLCRSGTIACALLWLGLLVPAASQAACSDKTLRGMADAGRSTSHSQRPSASPTTTDRSHSPPDPLTDTGQSPTGKLPTRTLTVGGPSPIVTACRSRGSTGARVVSSR